MSNFDQFEAELSEQTAALENLLAELESEEIAEEGLFSKPVTVEDMLDKVKKQADKCESCSDCESLLKKLKDEEDDFNKAIDALKKATQKLKDGEIDNDECKELVKDAVKDLKKKCDVLACKEIDEDADEVSTEEVETLRKFLVGARDIITEKCESFKDSECDDDDKKDDDADTEEKKDDAKEDSEEKCDDKEEKAEDDDAEDAADEAMIDCELDITIEAMVSMCDELDVIDTLAMESAADLGRKALAKLKNFIEVVANGIKQFLNKLRAKGKFSVPSEVKKAIDDAVSKCERFVGKISMSDVDQGTINQATDRIRTMKKDVADLIAAKGEKYDKASFVEIDAQEITRRLNLAERNLSECRKKLNQLWGSGDVDSVAVTNLKQQVAVISEFIQLLNMYFKFNHTAAKPEKAKSDDITLTDEDDVKAKEAATTVVVESEVETEVKEVVEESAEVSEPEAEVSTPDMEVATEAAADLAFAAILAAYYALLVFLCTDRSHESKYVNELQKEIKPKVKELTKKIKACRRNSDYDGAIANCKALIAIYNKLLTNIEALGREYKSETVKDAEGNVKETKHETLYRQKTAMFITDTKNKIAELEAQIKLFERKKKDIPTPESAEEAYNNGIFEGYVKAYEEMLLHEEADEMDEE